MPQQTFNIGRDFILSIVGPTGALGALGYLEEMTPNVESNILMCKPMNMGGVNVRRTVYGGWNGTMSFARINGIADALQNLLEANYYAGNPELLFQLTEIAKNSDGSFNTYNYLDVVMAMDSAGKREQDAKVVQTFKWQGSRRVGA